MDELIYLKAQKSAVWRAQPIVECSASGVVTDANVLFLEPLGYELSDVMGMPIATVLGGGEDEQTELPDFWQEILDGETVSVETHMARKDGGAEWVDILGAPVPGPDGEMLNIVLFIRFITEQKILSNDHKGQIRAISLSQAVVEFSMDGSILSANSLFLDKVGYSAEEITGRHHSMLVDLEYAESREYEIFWEDLRAGHYKTGEYKRVCKDGSEVWLQASYTPILDFNREPIKVVKYATFTTEQKLINSDFAGQISAIGQSQAVIEFNMDGTVLTANDLFLDAFGYELDEIAGVHHRIFIDPETTVPEEYEAFWRALRRGSFQSGEFKRLTKLGEPVWIQAFYTPILDLNQKPFKVVKYARVVTDQVESRAALEAAQRDLEAYVSELQDARRRLEEDAHKQVEMAEKLSAARDLAESANATKSAFLATMSHEIRTPMTGVMGYADLLLQDDLAMESRDKVLRIKESTQSLLAIINDILDLSKLEAGKVELEYLDFDLKNLIEAVVEKSNLMNDPAKDVKVQLELSDDIPDAVHSEPTRIRQILLNLIGNAVKFTEAGSISVECSMFDDPGYQGDMVRFSVSDTGIGIEPDKIDVIFEEFSQADASITRRYEGTGLGLPICKKIVNLMHGQIGVDSVPGEGSTFWFIVPIEQVANEVTDNLHLGAAEPTQFCATEQLNVLVAEDNPVNQCIIRMIVEGFGHKVHLVEDGRAACDALEETDFDFILMDIRMPFMSGLDATKYIRSMHGPKSRIPIIAITADVMADHKKEYIAAGMNAVVSKPINLSELANTINQVFDKSLHSPAPDIDGSVNVTNLEEHRKSTEIEEPIDPEVVKFLDSIQ